jgi:hypothetical protein
LRDGPLVADEKESSFMNGFLLADLIEAELRAVRTATVRTARMSG